MNRETFVSSAAQWRDKWNSFFETNDTPPRGWELRHEVVMTCSTETCTNYGRYWKDTVSEQLDGVFRVLCGLCQHPIEDMDPLLEDDETFRLNTRMPDGTSWMINPGGEELDD